MKSPDGSADRQFDVIVWGATGFTGRLVTEYLAKKHPPGKACRWAIAGRNRDKLDALVEELDLGDNPPEIVVANSHDPQAMLEMAGQTRVVLTTVGPYARYGSELVAACVSSGTHYCDLCGESQWIRKMIDQHHKAAIASGAKIVMCCGFDSIPSDMGVYCLQEMGQQLHDQHCTEMTLLVRAMRGGASGGTFASMLNAIEEAQADKSVARILSDPYGLNPEGEREGPDTRDQTGARFDKIAGLWTAPFVMAGINTRVVRRSNALSGYAYGRQFRYRESTITGTGLRGRFKASFGGLLLKLFIIAAAIPFTRKHLVQRLLPKPGQGPSVTERETGFFNMVLIGKLEDDSLM
ncbi:MAG: saccharopine dehydrogenase family protein, partial [Woeseiaceae bacterium]